MGKRINPHNLRSESLKHWESYCPSYNYSENFGQYIYLYKWCKNFFYYFINLFYTVRHNQIFVTLLIYLPVYNFSKKAGQRFFKRSYKHLKETLNRQLTYTQKQSIQQQFTYYKQLYKVQEVFYFRRLFTQYRKYLEGIFTKTLGRKVNVKIINVADLYRDPVRHKKLYSLYFILVMKLSSYYRRFSRNYKHIVKLLALSSYLYEPRLVILIIKRLFKVPRRHFLTLRFIKTYIDLIYLFNPNIKGVKFQIKGKFGGCLRTRKMIYQRGQIPTQTLNANIQYASDSLTNKAGIFGVRIWYYCGKFSGKDVDFSLKTDSLFEREESWSTLQKKQQNMVIKNFFYTWLNYKVRLKRKKQKKIVLKSKSKYGSNNRKITKKQTNKK